MKFKFVKKGKDISSEELSNLMDFEQLVNTAAGLGSAPLAKGGLASKSAFVSKALWVAAVPFTAAVYLGVTEFLLPQTEPVPEVPVEEVIEMQTTEPIIVDTASASDASGMDALADQPDSAPAATQEEAQPANADDEPKEEEPANDILVKEDIMLKAEPVGGFPAFYEFIDKELTYPEAARVSNIEGFVRVYFVVDKDGKAGNFRVVRSLGNHFDEEALRVMEMLTDWTPATHNGQPVTQHLSIKLRFELEEK